MKRIRTRYSRIYYHFRPEYYYWIMLIIGRKTAIALTSLLYRKNPSFQFAVALLVMFSAYVLQVKYQPYMSPSKMDKVVRKVQERAMEDPGGDYHLIVENCEKRLYHQNKRRSKGKSVNFRKETNNRVQSVSFSKAGKYMIDYNTVESTLLACSVFVCLAGICFEIKWYTILYDAWMSL